jgi:hypothetical protein
MTARASISPHRSTFDARASISRLASAQAGCISAKQLSELGLSSGFGHKNVQNGRFRRIFHGVFAIAGSPATAEQRCFAGLLFAGEDSALSHLTAAIMRQWWRRSPLDAIHITSGRRLRTSPLVTHSTNHWNVRDDIDVINGLRFTTPERTVLDLGYVLTRYQITSIIKEAAFWGEFDVRRFHDEAARLTGRPGSAVTRRAVQSYLAGCAGTRSALEDRMVQRIAERGLPLPDEAGYPIGPHEVDVVWHKRRLIIEVDGPGHRQPNSRKKDPQRDADLRAIGFEVVRFTNHAIDFRRDDTAARLERLLR